MLWKAELELVPKTELISGVILGDYLAMEIELLLNSQVPVVCIIIFGKEQVVICFQNLVSFGVRDLHGVLWVLLIQRFYRSLTLHD
jgi:hypothetical protein